MIGMCQPKIGKVILEVLCLVALSVALLATNLYIEPHKRGIFCNDQTIMYPYIENEIISTSNLVFIGLFFLFLVIIGEIFHARKTRSSFESLTFKLPNWMILIYHKAGTFLIGGITTVLIGDIIKLSVGRLRPHFMEACVPSINCSFPGNHNKYFDSDEFICTSNLTDSALREARLSFPSSHSSFVTYFGVYFICYLQLRMTQKNLRILKYLLQFIVVSIIWYVSTSRISDYWHHWSDVTVGIIIGFTNALITVVLVADLFNERRGYEINSKKSTEVDTEVTS